MLTTNLKRFRLIALIEGISYILLLFIAMPIKYMLDEPIVVKYVGMGHGVLFILFIILLAIAAIQYRWKLPFIIFAFIASLIPFGTFYLDTKLKKLDS